VPVRAWEGEGMVRVVSLCDLTGTMVRPWAEAGYDAVCYDLQHSIRADKVEQVGAGSITYRWADVRSLTATDIGRPSIVFAFPPCTHLANSGNRDKRRKGLRLLIDSLELVEACRVLCENSGAPYLIENPVGSLSTYWREPDERFNPCDFAGYLADPFPESYTKKTLLWMGGGLVMPQRRSVPPVLKSKMHLLSPSKDRANLRSATPEGFARAVFAANVRKAEEAA
jgi:hypothetical protein